MIEIHGVFDWGGFLFARTSIAASSDGTVVTEAYKLVVPAKFKGGEPSEVLGWNHGVKITHDGHEYRLIGPPAIFIHEPAQKPTPYRKPVLQFG